MNDSETLKCPLLEAILAIQNQPLQPLYSNRDLAKIFSVSVRAIQNWISSGQLTPRVLPGRWTFVSQDLEEFIRTSKKGKR